MHIIKLPRRGGKTTSALELLRDNEKSVMFQHLGMIRGDHPILEKNPELKRRIFSIGDYKERLRGKLVDTIIIDNADLLDKNQLLEMLHHFSTFPISSMGLCEVVLTITDFDDQTDKNQLQHMHKTIMEMFLNSCEIIIKEDLDDHEFKFCTDTIHNTLSYISMKRRS